MDRTQLLPGTLFRAPNGELYLMLDDQRPRIDRVQDPFEKKARELLDEYFEEGDPWVTAVHGCFFYPYTDRALPQCCQTQLDALEQALQDSGRTRKK